MRTDICLNDLIQGKIIDIETMSSTKIWGLLSNYVVAQTSPQDRTSWNTAYFSRTESPPGGPSFGEAIEEKQYMEDLFSEMRPEPTRKFEVGYRLLNTNDN